ncbi:MAG: penicillin-insensitive murein endopeptidase [Deltaproteobacteria bacterium]|nr:penicillin-insensitive murein endopeptidase [Deltaproteobacteria bacterium]
MELAKGAQAGQIELPMVALFALLSSLSAAATPDGGPQDAGPARDAAATIQAFDPRWSRVTAPTPGPALVIGQPGAGCVRGARALPLRGRGFVVVHPERNRHFGHPMLIAFVRDLAAQVRRQKLLPLFVGDLGQPRGGPTATGHRSHQSGIDVDIWYAPPARPWTPGLDPTPPAPVVVDLRTKKLLPAWNKKVARLVELVATNPAVDRIFVHPAIKRALCKNEARRGPWLRIVRPWWGHHDHLHARLRCPDDSPDCAQPQPLPEGEGCDASLDWWLSEEAAKAWAKRKPPGEGAPAMPEQCEELLGRNRHH